MYIDVAAIVGYLGICLWIIMSAVRLFFYCYSALWFYRNSKDELKEEK